MPVAQRIVFPRLLFLQTLSRGSFFTSFCGVFFSRCFDFAFFSSPARVVQKQLSLLPAKTLRLDKVAASAICTFVMKPKADSGAHLSHLHCLFQHNDVLYIFSQSPFDHHDSISTGGSLITVLVTYRHVLYLA